MIELHLPAFYFLIHLGPLAEAQCQEGGILGFILIDQLRRLDGMFLDPFFFAEAGDQRHRGLDAAALSISVRRRNLGRRHILMDMLQNTVIAGFRSDIDHLGVLLPLRLLNLPQTLPEHPFAVP